MKQIEKVAQGENFNVISVGNFVKLSDYVLPLGENVEIVGKVFCGNALKTNGCELSFQIFQPGQEAGFLHTHKTHEELYFFLRGTGEYQVDGKTFAVGEGSVVRVSPNGTRSVRNNGRGPLVMLCVQYRSNAFTADDAADAVILNKEVKW